MASKKHGEGKQIGGVLLKDGRWYARLVVKGRQVWRSAPTKEDAKLVLGRLIEAKERDELDLPRRSTDTLKDFAPKYLAWAKVHKRSWDRDELSLRPLLEAFGTFRLKEITRDKVDAYMRDRRKVETRVSVGAREAFSKRKKAGTVAPNAKPPAPAYMTAGTVNREVACLRKVLAYAVEVRELTANPLQGVRLFNEAPGRLPTLSPEDETALLAAMAPWLRPIYRFAVLSGCRLGEILALRWRHVDFGAGTLTVEDSKSGESRVVPLHPALADELRARRGLADGWVCAMPERARRDKETGKPLPPVRDPQSVSHAFKHAARAIGRSDLRWHDTRHLAGSALLATGASLPEVAAVLGHKTLVMSKRYAHVNPARLRDLFARMPAPATVPAPADGEATATADKPRR